MPNKSSAKALGAILDYEAKTNPDFYLFSPDETYSNKLDAIFNSTKRQWQRPIKSYEHDLGSEGQVIELLSENTLFAMLTGHILNGKQGALTSYEAFLPIISSQLDQYVKFLKQSREVSWRKPVSPLTILSTSTCWRQDHNGYSHQNPSLITSALAKPSDLTTCFFPIDATAAEASWYCAKAQPSRVNIITFNKTDEPQFVTQHQAIYELQSGGASLHYYASDDTDEPDIVLTSAGDIVSRETLYAMEIAKREYPEARLRYVGVSALSYNKIGTTQNFLSQNRFNDLFTTNKPIISVFHGYADTLKSILSQYTPSSRISAHGYAEEGSTTTPFDMLARNRCSRYNIVIDIFAHLTSEHKISIEKATKIIQKYQNKLAENQQYIKENGIDMEEISSWQYQPTKSS